MKWVTKSLIDLTIDKSTERRTTQFHRQYTAVALSCMCYLFDDIYLHVFICILECVVTPRPIRNYPDLYRGSVIFVDFPFQCSGTVTAVEFHASRAGTFYLSAWRPSASGTSWTLLGTYTITSAHSGAQVILRGYFLMYRCTDHKEYPNLP